MTNSNWVHVYETVECVENCNNVMEYMHHFKYVQNRIYSRITIREWNRKSSCDWSVNSIVDRCASHKYSLLSSWNCNWCDYFVACKCRYHCHLISFHPNATHSQATFPFTQMNVKNVENLKLNDEQPTQ